MPLTFRASPGQTFNVDCELAGTKLGRSNVVKA